MPGHDKLLKKVEQERAKGQFDRALGRLKEAVAQHPRDFELAQEAARLCFELGRTLEGANILRSAIKRCPSDRGFALDMLQREFSTSQQLELAEILYETHLAQGDLDPAREVVVALSESDRNKLLTKLQTKIASVIEEAPDDAPRLTSLRLAESLVLSSLNRPDEFAAALESALDLDPSQVQAVGRLAKAEIRQAADCAAVHLLLARCYGSVDKPELAAEHVVAAGHESTYVDRALERIDAASDSHVVKRARAELLLRAGRHTEAAALLSEMLESELRLEPLVRQALEAVPEALAAVPTHRLLLARALVGTGASRLALQELRAAQEAGVESETALTAAQAVLAADPRNVEAMLAHGRLAMAAGRTDLASEALKGVLEADPGRAEALRKEIEGACEGPEGDALRQVLVELYLHLEMPQEAADTLQRLDLSGSVDASTLYRLSGEIAAQYGFSAPLLLVFVESSLQTEHPDEARAAVAHYLAAPGARMAEFTHLLGELLRSRPEIGARLSPVLEGLDLPVELRFRLALASLQDGSESGLAELESLVTERPELQETALEALEEYLAQHAGPAAALILAGDLAEMCGRSLQAAQYLARALRSSSGETDRISAIAERVLRRDPKNHLCWREIITALIDTQRARHARELCYLAQQALPPEKHGFLHIANAEMLIASKQTQSAVNELESALACEDVLPDRVVALLEQVTAEDPKHGYARFVLAAALMRQGQELDTAVIHLSAAVQQDDLLVDLALELLAENHETLREHAPARVLDGLLHLRKGDQVHGLALLDQALDLQPLLAPQVLPTLEAEWDRDTNNAELGISFARALRGAGHLRRACRLVSDLARRFPDRQERLLGELQSMLDVEPMPDVHRALWEILLDRGRRDAALEHLQQAVEGTREVDALRELLDSASQRMPESVWIACRLAELETRAGHPDRTVEVLRSCLQRDASHWDPLLTCVRALPNQESNQELRLFEIDLLLAGHQGNDALAALRGFRSSFDQELAPVVERYRALVGEQTAGFGAELDLGTLLRECGRIEEAVGVIEAGLQRAEMLSSRSEADSKTERELRLSLAQLYVELGREDEGKRLLASVLDRPGDHAETYGFLERLARQGMLSRLRSLRDTITSYPSNLKARLELARLSIVSMDFDGAREALSFTGDTVAIEAARRYLLARSHADEDHPDLAMAVLRSIGLDDVGDEELRRNIAYLKAVCCEQLGLYSESHAHFLQILSEFPYFRDVRERVRRTYQKHLESALEPRAEVLEKRTQLDVN